VLEGEQKAVFATVGLSLSPMPQIEMYTENRFDLNRIELGLMLNSVNRDLNIQKIAEWLSGTCSTPWRDITFLGEGHTILFDAFDHPKFRSVLLTNKLAVLPKIELENYRTSVVNFLWLIPITDLERQFAMDNESKNLINRLNDLGEEIYSLERKELILDS